MWWDSVPQMWGSSQGRRVLLIEERGKGRIRELDRGVVIEETEQLPQPVVAGGSGRCTKVDGPRGRRGTHRNRVEVWRCLAPPRPTGCMPARDPSWPEPPSAAAVWLLGGLQPAPCPRASPARSGRAELGARAGSGLGVDRAHATEGFVAFTIGAARQIGQPSRPSSSCLVSVGTPESVSSGFVPHVRGGGQWGARTCLR